MISAISEGSEEVGGSTQKGAGHCPVGRNTPKKESFMEQLNSIQALEQLAPLHATREHLPKDIINILGTFREGRYHTL